MKKKHYIIIFIILTLVVGLYIFVDSLYFKKTFLIYKKVQFDVNQKPLYEYEEIYDLLWNEQNFKEFYEAGKKLNLESQKYLNKYSFLLILVDLNDDRKKDFIAILANNPYWCGKGGKDCPISIYVSSEKGYKNIYFNQVIPWWTMIYILKTSKDGIRDIIVNEKFLHRYNAKQDKYELTQKGF